MGIDLSVGSPYPCAQATYPSDLHWKLEELRGTLKCPLCAEVVSAPHRYVPMGYCASSALPLTGSHRVDHCGHVFCCACLVEFFELEVREHNIVGLHQCLVVFCRGIIDSSPVQDIRTEGIVSQLQLAEGKEVTGSSTPLNFFDKYFIIDTYLESCAKPPVPHNRSYCG